MRGVIWLVLLFAVAVVAATTLGRNDGLVSLYWSGWRSDLSLNLFVVLLVAFCFVLTIAWQALHGLTTLPRRASQWRSMRKERAAEAALRESLAEYFSARYSRAQKAALRALAIHDDSGRRDAEFAVLAQLLAAASLHRLQDRTRRDAVLDAALPRAARPSSRADDGARLLAAEWALEDRDTDRALALLAELPPGVARRTQALRLKLQASRLARRPLDALHTARLLAHHGAFSPAASAGLLRSLAFEAIDTAHDGGQLRKVWQQLDAADRRDTFVAARAAARAGALESADEARNWLRPYWDRLAELSKDEREQIALALLDASEGLGTDWLSRAEDALIKFGHEAPVAAAVGMAFAECGLWGKARRLLEQTAAAAQLPGPVRRRAWRALAALAREEGDAQRERDCEAAAATID
jgi:HemY protein